MLLTTVELYCSALSYDWQYLQCRSCLYFRTLTPLPPLHSTSHLSFTLSSPFLSSPLLSSPLLSYPLPSFPLLLSSPVLLCSPVALNKSCRLIDIETGLSIGTHDGKEALTVGQGARAGGCSDKYFVSSLTAVAGNI